VKRFAVAAGVIAAGGAILAGVLVATTGGGSDGDFRGSRPPARVELPDFTLRDFRGPSVQSRDTRGKAVLVTFLESKCTESCPIVASQVARGLRLLQPDERSRVVALAISTHPGDDTPASVRTFLRRHRAEQALHYLVGTEAELRPVWRAFQVLPALDTGDPNLHSVPVRIFDPDGVWVSTLHTGADLTPANLRHDVLEALS